MELKKESAQGPASIPGREADKLELSPRAAIAALVAILTEKLPLAHVKSDWVCRSELATLWGVTRATVTRRCRLAGVTERMVIEHGRAKVEFWKTDVQRMLGDE